MAGEDVHHGKAQASTSYPQQPENIDMRWINRFNDLRVDDIYYRPPYPPGFKFDPADEELIEYYLKPKVYGKQVPCNVVIDANLYQYHPKELAEKFKSIVKDVWYVFTSRNRKYANGGRPDRSAGSGYWKATGSDQEIVDKAEQRIGYKKALVYHEGRQPSKDKTVSVYTTAFGVIVADPKNWSPHESGEPKRYLKVSDKCMVRENAQVPSLLRGRIYIPASVLGLYRSRWRGLCRKIGKFRISDAAAKQKNTYNSKGGIEKQAKDFNGGGGHSEGLKGSSVVEEE
ncbi:hypothetical protein COCNU_02G015400 [Cocos nucifera]|uniref:NAC domain-containing protein n=1 Tax=Cocos nucifera TaxID=13894 RepID=A0A8K0I0X5_COCNU|nr:hypothetical protein COCNU_02G015400 [Cocos nucifera]